MRPLRAHVALGWPAAEELEPLIAKFTGAADELAETAGRAPSLLNGGLGQVHLFYWCGCLALAVAVAVQVVHVCKFLIPINKL